MSIIMPVQPTLLGEAQRNDARHMQHQAILRGYEMSGGNGLKAFDIAPGRMRFFGAIGKREKNGHVTILAGLSVSKGEPGESDQGTREEFVSQAKKANRSSHIITFVASPQEAIRIAFYVGLDKVPVEHIEDDSASDCLKLTTVLADVNEETGKDFEWQFRMMVCKQAATPLFLHNALIGV